MEEQLSAFALAVIVEQMRNAQKGYLTAINKANETQTEEDFFVATRFFNQSILHQLLVDETIKEIMGNKDASGNYNQFLNLSERARMMGELQLIANKAEGLEKKYYLDLITELCDNHKKAKEVENV